VRGGGFTVVPADDVVLVAAGGVASLAAPASAARCEASGAHALPSTPSTENAANLKRETLILESRTSHNGEWSQSGSQK
jgi:hypothetical protein